MLCNLSHIPMNNCIFLYYSLCGLLPSKLSSLGVNAILFIEPRAYRRDCAGMYFTSQNSNYLCKHVAVRKIYNTNTRRYSVPLHSPECTCPFILFVFVCVRAALFFMCRYNIPNCLSFVVHQLNNIFASHESLYCYLVFYPLFNDLYGWKYSTYVCS